SLQLNLPPTAIRDLIVKDNDLAVATHGRSFWILDDISALRQLEPSHAAVTRLFKPSQAWRVRSSRWPDTPLPPDEPAGANPPDGAIIDYQLASDARSPVTLEVLDQAGKLVRRFSSDDPEEQMVAGTNVPTYWMRP